MPSACTQFFRITELLMHLGPYLDRNTLAKLMGTSQQLNEIFTPFFYYDLDFFDEPSRDFRLLQETTPTESLTKSMRHVRELSTGPLFTGYYFQCLLKYQGQLPLLAKPFWVPPLDMSNTNIIPLPPMANLTEFNCFAQPGPSDRSHRCHVKSTRLPKVRQAQVLWIIQNCPNLVNLGLEVYVDTQREVLLLASVISKISRLRRLELSVQKRESDFRDLGSTIFFSVPPTVDELDVHFDEYVDEDDDEDVYYHSNNGGNGSSGGDGYESTGPPRGYDYHNFLFHLSNPSLTPRQEPLSNLTRLVMQAVKYNTFSDIVSIFQHCPNLMTLHAPELADQINDEELAREIARYCPNLRSLAHTSSEFDGRLVMSLMGALPENQLEVLKYYRLDKDSTTTATLIRRHSSTLRTIRFNQCLHISSKAIQSILVGCRALEDLLFDFSDPRSVTLELEDAIEFPWSATRLKSLQLVVAIGYMTSLQVSNPYYKRGPPVYFSQDETRKLALLERLYRQIGQLIQLEKLVLKARVTKPGDDDENGRSAAIAYRHATFPGFLSLGDSTTSRPGFLHLLAGLKKLKVLAGSVHGGTAETLETMGQKEVEWVVENWVSIERANFCCVHSMVHPGTNFLPWFVWLKAQKPNLFLNSMLWR
ncbi:hypothetical protein BGX23_002779 [Mortierella sp. AD031]|nr:hypothetical protein BGX23_002779 [Mortierella sp. AD031]